MSIVKLCGINSPSDEEEHQAKSKAIPPAGAGFEFGSRLYIHGLSREQAIQ